MSHVLSEDLDQPGHSSSRIRVLITRLVEDWDSAIIMVGAQADLHLFLVHMPCGGLFGLHHEKPAFCIKSERQSADEKHYRAG